MPALIDDAYREAALSLADAGFGVGLVPFIPFKKGDAWPKTPAAVGSIGLLPNTTLEHVRRITTLRDLRSIGAYGGRLPPEGLEPLSAVTNLMVLRPGRMLTEPEMAQLSTFRKLRNLAIYPPSDASLAPAVKSLPHLTALELQGDKISDACLSGLEEIATLRNLTIHWSAQISEAAAQRFLAQRPDVQVTWQGQLLMLKPSEPHPPTAQSPPD
jgi:hypothetical protein